MTSGDRRAPRQGVWSSKTGSKVSRSLTAARASPASAARRYSRRAEATSPVANSQSPRLSNVSISAPDRPEPGDGCGAAEVAVDLGGADVAVTLDLSEGATRARAAPAAADFSAGSVCGPLWPPLTAGRCIAGTPVGAADAWVSVVASAGARAMSARLSAEFASRNVPTPAATATANNARQRPKPGRKRVASAGLSCLGARRRTSGATPGCGCSRFGSARGRRPSRRGPNAIDQSK